MLSQLLQQQAAPAAKVEVVVNDTTSKGEKVDAAVLALVSEAVNKAVNDIYEASADKIVNEEKVDSPPAGTEGETRADALPVSVEGETVVEASAEGEQQLIVAEAPQAEEEEMSPRAVRAAWETGFAQEMARDTSREVLNIFHPRFLGNAEVSRITAAQRKQLTDTGFFHPSPLTAQNTSITSPAGNQFQVIDVLSITAEGKTQEEALKELDRLKAAKENEKKSLEYIKQLALLEKDEMDGEQRMLLTTGEPEALYRQRQADVEQLLKDKREKFEEEKARWLKIMNDRKRPERITAVEVHKAALGTKTNLKFLREGHSAPTKIEDVKVTNLGASEWYEIYTIIKDKKAASYEQLQEMLKSYFEKALKFEMKFKADLPMLRAVFGSPAAVSSSAGRRIPKRKLAVQPLLADLPPISGDAALILRLPPRSSFEEGKILEEPAGIFFQNFRNDQLFFKLAEIERASTNFLISIRRRFAKMISARPIISRIDEELMKPARRDDPALRIAKQEDAWEIEAANL